MPASGGAHFTFYIINIHHSGVACPPFCLAGPPLLWFVIILVLAKTARLNFRLIKKPCQSSFDKSSEDKSMSKKTRTLP